ncbi:hypothetical protein ILUMI_25564, partial [Ignelater luminosus]
ISKMNKSGQSGSNESIWELNVYEISRTPQEIFDDDTEIGVTPRAIENEVKCPICFDLLKNTVTAKGCLHRFCSDCITKALRIGNKECPTCRKKIVSRRCLRADPNFDQLIAKLYPNREEIEDHQTKFFNEIAKYSYQGKNATDESKKISKTDLKQAETVTVSSSNSDNIVQGNTENVLESNDNYNKKIMVHSSVTRSSTEVLDVRNQTDEHIASHPTTSLRIDNVDSEDNNNPETNSDTTNDIFLKLEAPRHQDILLQPSTSATSKDSSITTIETPKINEQASTLAETDSNSVSEDNINLSGQEHHLHQNILLQPLDLVSLSSNSVHDECSNIDGNEYKTYEQTAILPSTSKVAMNISVESSSPYSLRKNTMKQSRAKDLINLSQSNTLRRKNKKGKLRKKILTSLSLELGYLNLSTNEDNINKPKQIASSFPKKNIVTDDTEWKSDRSISPKSLILSSKDASSSVTSQTPLQNDIKIKLNEKINLFSLSTNDVSTEDNLSDLASLPNQTTSQATTSDFDITNQLQKKFPKMKRIWRRRFSQRRRQKAVASSSTSNQNPHLKSSINLDCSKAVSSDTNSELLQESSTQSDERKTDSSSGVSGTRAHSSNSGLIQGSGKTSKTNKKTNVRKKGRRPPSNTSFKKIELELKLLPSNVTFNDQIHKVLRKNLIRYIETPGNATIDHLGKYLEIVLTPSLDTQMVCDSSEFCFYVLSFSNSYIQLDGNQTISQVDHNHGTKKKPLEIYYSYIVLPEKDK